MNSAIANATHSSGHRDALIVQLVMSLLMLMLMLGKAMVVLINRLVTDLTARWIRPCGYKPG